MGNPPGSLLSCDVLPVGLDPSLASGAVLLWLGSSKASGLVPVASASISQWDLRVERLVVAGVAESERLVVALGMTDGGIANLASAMGQIAPLD